MRTHLHSLDFLRGIAAFCVLLLHWFDGIGLPWFGRGGLCVDFFFVLSGFVIAYSYQDRLATRQMSRPAFLYSRFVRLYPMIAAGVAFGAFRATLHKLASPDGITFAQIAKAAGANLLLCPILTISPLSPGYREHRIIPGSAFPLDMVFWSLFYEALANLVWMRLAHRSSRTLAAISLVGLTGLAFPDLVRLQSHSVAAVLFNEWPRVTFSFFAGVLVYRIHQTGRFRAYSVGPWPLSAALLALCAIPPAIFGSVVLDLIAIVVFFPLMVLFGANHSKTAAVPFATLLGDLSYPLYVLQVPAMWLLTGVAKSLHLYRFSAFTAISVVLIPALVCALSWLTFRYFDQPIRQALRCRLPGTPKHLTAKA